MGKFIKVLAFLGILIWNLDAVGNDTTKTKSDVVYSTLYDDIPTFEDLEFEKFLSSVPCHHEYETWDTTTIHPYKWANTKTDTSLLFLVDHKDCGFVPPINGRINSHFGPRRGRYHYGIDLQLRTGDSVVSAFDGKVRISVYHPQYGNVIVVRHYNGLETLYAHLSKRKVNCGELIRAGELLGYGGTTGRSTGPHLHFEVRYKGRPIDPNKVINFEANQEDRDLHNDTLIVCDRIFNYSKYTKHTSYKPATAKYIYVRKGETISKLAVRHNSTVNRICQLNKISRSTPIRPGQKLRVR